MFYSSQSLTGFQAVGHDGELGDVRGFRFHLDSWAVDGIAIATTQDPGPTILVDPADLRVVDGTRRQIRFDISLEQLRNRPGFCGAAVHEVATMDAAPDSIADRRWTSTVLGFDVQTTDGPAGRVADVILDTWNWRVHRFVARLGWLWHSHRMIPTSWVRQIDPDGRTLALDVDRATVRAAEHFILEEPANRTRQIRIVDYA